MLPWSRGHHVRTRHDLDALLAPADVQTVDLTFKKPRRGARAIVETTKKPRHGAAVFCFLIGGGLPVSGLSGVPC